MQPTADPNIVGTRLYDDDDNEEVAKMGMLFNPICHMVSLLTYKL